MIFAYLSYDHDVALARSTDPEKISQCFSQWGWHRIQESEQVLYKETVQMFSGKGTVATALGLMCAFWGGPVGRGWERLVSAVRDAGPIEQM